MMQLLCLFRLTTTFQSVDWYHGYWQIDVMNVIERRNMIKLHTVATFIEINNQETYTGVMWDVHYLVVCTRAGLCV